MVKNPVNKKMLVLILTAFLVFLTGCAIRDGVDAVGNDINIIDRVAFTVFGRNIYWYAICIITGIALAYFTVFTSLRKPGLKKKI